MFVLVLSIPSFYGHNANQRHRRWFWPSITSPKNGHSFQCAKIIIIMDNTNKIEIISTRASGKIFKNERIMMHNPLNTNDLKSILPRAQGEMPFYRQDTPIFRLVKDHFFDLFLSEFHPENHTRKHRMGRIFRITNRIWHISSKCQKNRKIGHIPGVEAPPIAQKRVRKIL